MLKHNQKNLTFGWFNLTRCRILGPTALLQLAEKKDSLPSITRPMYTQAMVGTVVVFTGFRKKDELVSFILLIDIM